MIFSRLFNKKDQWQAKDSNLRIAAINEQLNGDSSTQKDILLSLLKDDESELVRRAALLKLDSFETYLLASKENSNKSLKQFAGNQVNAILANEHKITLTIEQKANFLNNEDSQPFINQWLEHEQDPNLVIELFKQVGKRKNITSLLAQIFNQKQNSQTQQQLLSLELGELTDTNFLTKLVKKAVDNDVVAIIENKIEEIQSLREQPKKIHKQLQLILSKLLALKDVANYVTYIEKRDVLEQEWISGIKSIACLSDDIQETLKSKYINIVQQLDKIFAVKAEAFQQDIIAQQVLESKQAAQSIFTNKITEINQAITTAVFEDQTLDEQTFHQQLAQLSDEITASVLNTKEQGPFIEQVSALAKRLTKLPDIAQSVSQATHLISKMAHLAPPESLTLLNERQSIYRDWLAQWRKVENTAEGYLPQSIKEAYSEIAARWNTAISPLQNEQKQLFNQTKKKLLDIKRLLNNGKYKVCFGLFKGVNQSWPLLSENQQQHLNQNYNQVDEKIKEISDWEHYIATPRKQELLNNIVELANNPLDNPNEQADKVKQYRKAWNALGHAEESLDKTLNEDFNHACEQAFAPCRLFYAEQEKLRAQHLIERKNIIEQATNLSENFESEQLSDLGDKELAARFKKLDGQLHKIQQTWDQAGEVDRKDYQGLLKQFKNILVPVKQAIKAFHEENTQKKLSLITKAEQELSNEDTFQAINNIKQLQQQWRDVGFAGSHQENKLWQTFRKINDEIFASRDQIKTEQQAAKEKLTEQFDQSLSVIKTSLTETSDKNELNQALEKAQELHANVLANKPVIKNSAFAIEAFIKQTKESINKLALAQAKENWLCLFSLLKQLAHSEQSDDVTQQPLFAQLNSFWQKRVVDLSQQTQYADMETRLTKTLSIEILAQVDSPTEFAQQRMAVQVKLMQEQMQSGGDIDLTAQFVEWLMLGKLSQADEAQLTRLEKIYVQ